MSFDSLIPAEIECGYYSYTVKKKGRGWQTADNADRDFRADPLLQLLQLLLSIRGHQKPSNSAGFGGSGL